MSALAKSWLLAILAAGHGRRFQASLPASRPGADEVDKLAARLGHGERVLVQTLRVYVHREFEGGRLAVFTRGERVREYSSWAAEVGFASPIEWETVEPDHRGIGDTLRTVAQWALATPQSSRWLLIALGDMPFIQPASLTRLQQSVARASCKTLAWRLCHRGQPGHPVVLRRELWSELLGLHGDRGARDLLASMNGDQFHAVEVEDPGVLSDVDCYGDLQLINSSEWFRSRSG